METVKHLRATPSNVDVPVELQKPKMYAWKHINRNAILGVCAMSGLSFETPHAALDCFIASHNKIASIYGGKICSLQEDLQDHKLVLE